MNQSKLEINNNYSMSPSWIWSDKITYERVARVGYSHFISNKGKWNNCFSKYLKPGFAADFYFNNFTKRPEREIAALFSIWRKTRNIGW